MSHDVCDRIDVVGMIQVSNEPEGFGIRHGAGKGGSKTSDAGELNDAGFPVRIGTEVLDVVIERFFHGVDHPRNVPRLFLEVIDFQFDAIPAIAGDFIAGRREAIKIHRRMVESVLEVATTILLPFAHQGSGSDGDLIRRRADRGANIDPIGVAGNVSVPAILVAITFGCRHQVRFPKAILLALN